VFFSDLINDVFIKFYFTDFFLETIIGDRPAPSSTGGSSPPPPRRGQPPAIKQDCPSELGLHSLPPQLVDWQLKAFGVRLLGLH
jgi:hypothetical protein